MSGKRKMEIERWNIYGGNIEKMKIFSDTRKRKKKKKKRKYYTGYIEESHTFLSFDRRVRAIYRVISCFSHVLKQHRDILLLCKPCKCTWARISSRERRLSYSFAPLVRKTRASNASRFVRQSSGYNKEYFASRKPGVFSSFSWFSQRCNFFFFYLTWWQLISRYSVNSIKK